MRRIVVLVCLLALLAACAPAQQDAAATTASEAPAATEVTAATAATADEDAAPRQTLPPEVLDFTAATVDGGTLEGSDLAGADLALWFWAPWCGVCNREAPDVAEVAAEMGDQVRIVGVAGRDLTGPMRDFVAEHGLEGLTHIDDGGGEIWDRFGVVGQPTWIFVDGETGAVEGRLGLLGADDLRAALTDLAA